MLASEKKPSEGGYRIFMLNLLACTRGAQIWVHKFADVRNIFIISGIPIYLNIINIIYISLIK